jgi:pimeloyl-ACP methyl ester carboxylesterase
MLFIFISLFVLAWNIPSIHAAGEELWTIPTRPGVTQPFLLVRPPERTFVSVILFAGGDGRLQLAAEGVGWGKNNFLVRNRTRFAEQGFLVAVVDTPSGRSQGLWNFRASATHAEDMKQVIAQLKKITPAPVWLIGTSMGTVSAANVAARLKEGGPDGLILTSTVTKESKQYLESLNSVRLKDIRVPTLFVHHKKDSCSITSLDEISEVMKNLTQAPRVELITFDGGEPPQSEPCEARSYHGFFGIDAEVVSAIVTWIKSFAAEK